MYEIRNVLWRFAVLSVAARLGSNVVMNEKVALLGGAIEEDRLSYPYSTDIQR